MKYKRKNIYDTDFDNILAIAGGFTIIYIVTKTLPFIIVSLSVLVLGILSPYLSRLISQLWLGLSKVLGMVSASVILTIVFFLILFPIAVFSRIFKTTKSIHLSKGTGSYFHTRNHTFTTTDLDNTW